MNPTPQQDPMETALQRKLRERYGRRDFNGKHRKARVEKFQAAQRKKKEKRRRAKR